MKLKNKGANEGIKKFNISILLYFVATVVGVMGVALLADNIFIFKSTVTQYVMQGYAPEDVMKSLIPTQLLPGIFEALAVYGGMTFALIGIGVANKRISKYLTTLNIVENVDVMEESVLDESIDELENIEATDQEEQKVAVDCIESKQA